MTVKEMGLVIVHVHRPFPLSTYRLLMTTTFLRTWIRPAQLKHWCASIFWIACLLPATAVCGGRSTTSSGYPYEAVIKCDEKPSLTPAAVAAVAEYAKLAKIGGFWEIQYIHSQPNGGDPFTDNCIWKVSSWPSKDATLQSGTIGLDFIYIEDATKKFWRPAWCFDSKKGQWCMPKSDEIPTAP
ncbi:MAG: hypothetical protein WB760_33985 [Xanthobacteraceae bacterium]